MVGRPERALRELVADTVHRRADLLTMYRAADDAALRVKLSAELSSVGNVIGSAAQAGVYQVGSAAVPQVAEGGRGGEGAVETVPMPRIVRREHHVAVNVTSACPTTPPTSTPPSPQ